MTRGRPPKQPLSQNIRLAITVLLYGLEKKLQENGVISNGIDCITSKKVSYAVTEELLNVNKRIWRNSEGHERYEFHQDTFKNLMRIKNEKDNCDMPRISTLDAIVQYVFGDNIDTNAWSWNDYYKIFHNNLGSSVAFIDPSSIKVETLDVNEMIILGWIPAHFYLLQYLGDYKFRVVIAGDGMLRKMGEEFYATSFSISFPTSNGTLVCKDGSKIDITFPSYAPPFISFIPPINPIEILE